MATDWAGRDSESGELAAPTGTYSTVTVEPASTSSLIAVLP